jgi:hypothetical protein
VTECRHLTPSSPRSGPENAEAMFNRPPSRSSPPPGSIEFELTDIEDARASLEELPAGVNPFGRMQAGFWESRRRPRMATDRALTGCSLQWLMELPPMLKPRGLSERFPRILNWISESWSDTDKSLDLFEHLLDDRRTGRRGFPEDIQHEIEMLCEHRVTLASMRSPE